MFHPFGYPAPPFAPPLPDPNAWMGKTRYHYWTPDGGPPMDGKVPTGSAFDPPSNTFAAPPPPYMPGFCAPAPTPQTPRCCPPGLAPACCVPAPPKCNFQRPRSPPSAQKDDEFRSTGQRAAPLEANRVKGQLPRFDNGMNYIFPDRICTLHVFEHNIIQKYAPNTCQGEIKPVGKDLDFQVHNVSCDFTFRELIKKLDTVRRANTHPYFRHSSCPEEKIGLVELLPTGHGTFVIGTGIMLRDYTIEKENEERREGRMPRAHRSKDTLETLWPSSVGSAGEEKPRYIVRVPI